jgi:hypothetical protein
MTTLLPSRLGSGAFGRGAPGGATFDGRREPGLGVESDDVPDPFGGPSDDDAPAISYDAQEEKDGGEGVPKAAIGVVGAAVIAAIALAIVLIGPGEQVIRPLQPAAPVAVAAATDTALSAAIQASAVESVQPPATSNAAALPAAADNSRSVPAAAGSDRPSSARRFPPHVVPASLSEPVPMPAPDLPPLPDATPSPSDASSGSSAPDLPLPADAAAVSVSEDR